MIFFLFFRNLYVSLNFSDNEECTLHNPCSYSKGIEFLETNSNLHVMDSTISGQNNLTLFRTLVDRAVSLHCNIDGNNVILNGIDTFFPGNSFLFINNATIDSSLMRLKNIKFYKFSNAILHIRNCSNIELSNLTFESCSNDRKNSMIIISSSNIKISNLQIIKCTSHDSSIISVFSSNISFLSSSLYQNFLFHGSKQPLLMSIRSNLSFTDSLFKYNNSPVSPFIRLEDYSMLYIDNSSFLMNKNAEIVLSDGYQSQTTITNSHFNDNHGILFISSTASFLSFEFNIITNVCSFDYSLVSLFNSTGKIKNNKFINAAGLNIIETNYFSSLFLINNVFDFCKPYRSVLHSKYSSFNEISNCNFTQTISKDSVILIEKESQLLLSECLFSASWSTVFYVLGNSLLDIKSSQFKNSFASSKRVLYGTKASVSFKNCTFKDESLGGMFNFHNGTLNLQFLSFDAPQNYALNSYASSLCSNCKFGSYSIYSQKSGFPEYLYLSFLLFLIILVCLFVLRKKKIRNLFRRFILKNK